MKSKLKTKTQEWMSLERKTFEQRKIADQFYEEELMGQIVDEYKKNNQNVLDEKVDYLIMSVGTSYEPLVLNIELLQPKKIHFLYTETSEYILDKIAEMCKLKPSRYEKSKVNEIESTDIYREIRQCYLKWNKPERIYIDFTGGTKAMATAAAMSGTIIKVRMLYVGTNQYLPDFRKPMPGSERLKIITNPMAVFGDMEIEKANALFIEHNYAGVCERLEQLKEDVPDPAIRQELEFAYLLAKSYEEWDALKFMQACENMHTLIHQINRDLKHSRKFVLADQREFLNSQKEMLLMLSEIPALVKEKKNMEILSQKKYIIPLMFTMYQSAAIREEQEKYDMATLLLYRLLEMIEQRQLAKYHLYVSCMDYSKINTIISEADGLKILKERVCELKKQVFGRCNSDHLQDQVSLLEGFIILAVLEDELFESKEKTVIYLKRIRAMVSLRNNSIFAHGLIPCNLADFMKFKGFVLELFRRFCELEKINFEDYAEKIHWIGPQDSIYYRVNGR